MHRPLLIALLAIALPVSLLAGLAGGGWATSRRGSERERSQAAAERPCERAYVTQPPVGVPGLTRVVAKDVADLEQPSTVAFPPGGTSGVIGQREGLVLAFDGEHAGPPVLDFTGHTLTEGDGGLLAATYSPDGAWLYLYRTRADNDDVIAAYPVVGGRPDGAGERIVLELPHPPPNQHHGGGLVFGPDGYLYIGTGDGGGLGDPLGNAQDLGVLLGKILRIDPDPSGDEPYRIPDDNPFVGRAGARPEIFAYGLRNPYRISFDAVTGDLWIADVGQNCWEELDLVPGGSGGGVNFEWDMREGTHAFQGGHAADGVEPVLTFSHRSGWCAIVGGYTYRGAALPALDGYFLFTDWCAGRVLGVRVRPGESPELVDIGVEADSPIDLAPGPDGEPYVLSIEGEVERVVPARAGLFRIPVTG